MYNNETRLLRRAKAPDVMEERESPPISKSN